MDNLIMEMADEVRKKLGDGYRVDLQEILKNNDTLLSGLIISMPKEIVSSVIYLDDFVQKYQKGISLEQIGKEIILTYQNSICSLQFDICKISDFQFVKDKIIFSLINTSKNKKFLSDIPYFNFLDLSIIFKISLQSDESAFTSITIHQSLLDLWQTTADELYSIAFNNTLKLFPAQISPLEEIIQRLGYEMDADIAPENFSLYVLSDFLLLNGCSYLLYPNILKDFADKLHCDFYILPSSIHELLLLPGTIAFPPIFLAQMVREVNATVVNTEEVLSDNVYYFSAETQEITLLTF